ncbi:MAG: DJ-1/PfpI family protein [Terracidiphilus sp.]
MNAKAVYLFVFGGMADWEPAFATAAINNPAFQRQPGRYRVVTAGAAGASIVTMGGLRILPETTLRETEPANSALLMLPGGQAWEQGGNGEAVDAARQFLAAGVPVAAICAATLALARAGLLDDRRHTSNAAAYLAASGYKGAGLYSDAPAVTDGNVITASGVAPIEFAREIFRKLELYEDAVVEAWFALYRHGDASQYYKLASSTC